MRCLRLVAPVTLLLLLLFLSSVSALADPDLPDRSILWRSEEALGHALPDDILESWQQRRVDYGYDVDDYDLEMAIDLSSQLVDAAGTMTVTVTDPGLTELLVDLDDDLTVTRVTIDNVDHSFIQTPDQVLITLPSPPGVGSQLAVRVEYNGHPPIVGNKSMRFATHSGTPLVYTLSTPYSNASTTVIPISHHWRPCKDVPDDKSTFSAVITVPDNMLACSNGLLTSDVLNGNGTRTFTWEHDFPVAPYLITVAATNYVTIEETYVGPGGSADVQHFVWPEHLTQAIESFNITVPAMEFFGTVFGEYPFIGEKYGMFETPGGPAVEEQTMVAYPSNLIGGHTYDWILVHELAHMWWGDCVTCQSWDHVWLNEGFASYSEALWWEHLFGFGALRSYMAGMDNGPYAGTIYDPPYVWHSIVYDKGGWVLHMLRHIIGDGPFFQLLLDYRNTHEFGNVVSEDFFAAAESAHGADLDWFFDPWIFEEGRPTYEYGWWAEANPEPASTYTIHLIIDQVQSGTYPTYTMPIDVRVGSFGGIENFVAWDSLRTQTFEFVADNEPLSVILDADGWVLADFHQVTVDVATAPPASPPAFLAQNHPNPFNPATTIDFGLSRPGKVALRVFDISGRMVRTLVRESLPAGRHKIDWNGRDDRGESLANGVYLYRLVGPDGVSERRMTLLR